MSQEFSYQDVAEHNTKKDLYVVIHDKVYDITKFVDEHPGGEEVLLDVGGQDSTEAFEDVGHSDEAREALDKLLVGDLKRQAGDPEPSKRSAPANVGTAESTGSGIALYGIVLLGGVIAYFTLQYLQAKDASSQQA